MDRRKVPESVKGQEQKFRQELVDLLPRLWRFGLSLSGNTETCDDLVQATCERALSRYHQWKNGSRLDRWVFAIMHSIWMNELRSQCIRRGAGFVDPEQHLFLDDAHSTESSVLVQQTYEAVMSLPEAQRSAMLLVYVEGYSYQEAADTVDVPIGTIMSRLARARLQLSDALDRSAAKGVGQRRDHSP